MQKMNKQEKKNLLGAPKKLSFPKVQHVVAIGAQRAVPSSFIMLALMDKNCISFFSICYFNFFFQVNTVGTNFLQSSPVLGSDFVFQIFSQFSQIFSQFSQIFSHERNWHINEKSQKLSNLQNFNSCCQTLQNDFFLLELAMMQVQWHYRHSSI